jgi:hypothetical protein
METVIATKLEIATKSGHQRAACAVMTDGAAACMPGNSNGGAECSPE